VSGYRAPFAEWRGLTELGAEIEHRLIERGDVVSWQQLRRHRPRFDWSKRPIADGPRQDSSDVGVEHRHSIIEGEGRHCVSGVFAHAGQSEQLGNRRRHLSFELVADHSRCPVQGLRTPVIAESLPESQYVGE
jgi:hypothetical protein